MKFATKKKMESDSMKFLYIKEEEKYSSVGLDCFSLFGEVTS
jgi:hypothetical protein